MPTIEIKRIPAGNGNCYLLSNGKNAVLADTGREQHRDKILSACQGYPIRLLVLTHGHVDHVQNAAYFAEKLQIPIAMHREDADLLKDNMLQPLSAKSIPGKIVLAASIKSFQKDKIAAFEPEIFLSDGDTLDAWGIPAKVVHLPGHTRGSIGLDVMEKHLIVGDALMNMFYPTVSMLYNDRAEMLKSARKITDMGERTIWFGHGKPVGNREWAQGM